MVIWSVILILIFLNCYSKTIKTTVPKIVRIIPHKSQGYTQGLLIKNDTLIESTGLFKKSKLYLLSLKTGKILKKKPLLKHFGEGISLSQNQKLYQLTWKAQKVYIWNYPNLSLIDSISYKGEGWGLTQNQTHFIMSNGSDTLFFKDQTTFQNIKKLPVTYLGNPLKGINELEYAHQSIYANIYLTPYIVKINPQTGIITELIYCQNLIDADPKIKQKGEVLNGIAYNKKTDLFYLTGKNWNLIFEVHIN